jgi:hypothetical protein
MARGTQKGRHRRGAGESAEEGTVLWQLDRLVSRLANLRNRIRQGKRLSAEQ